MFNIVELAAPDDEQKDAPCKWGNIVEHHACYCHADHWKEGPRKCPVWRQYGIDDLTKWHKREWETVILPMFKGYDPEGRPIAKDEPRPCMPDDDLGGCPMFEARNTAKPGADHEG